MQTRLIFCPVCYRAFGSRNAVARHVRDSHRTHDASPAPAPSTAPVARTASPVTPPAEPEPQSYSAATFLPPAVGTPANTQPTNTFEFPGAAFVIDSGRRRPPAESQAAPVAVPVPVQAAELNAFPPPSVDATVPPLPLAESTASSASPAPPAPHELPAPSFVVGAPSSRVRPRRAARTQPPVAAPVTTPVAAVGERTTQPLAANTTPPWITPASRATAPSYTEFLRNWRQRYGDPEQPRMAAAAAPQPPTEREPEPPGIPYSLLCQLQSMGFESEEISKAYDSATLHGSIPASFMEVLEHLLVGTTEGVPSAQSPGGSPTNSIRAREVIRVLQLRIEELESKFHCTICMTEQINAAFTPCGHHVCCVRCAAPLRNCPICRRAIISVLRTYC
eukprot:TRINITY_DN29022_c0_g1_i1.p1 TRINITY_DN29022_c0_g1~~TRINITY_DN29022_c0_g1_i1.p1  ORF type:complete len:392 (+),score=28.68 TRINITY_DN29022_c0_g1_i1:74-1249(+)